MMKSVELPQLQFANSAALMSETDYTNATKSLKLDSDTVSFIEVETEAHNSFYSSKAIIGELRNQLSLSY